MAKFNIFTHLMRAAKSKASLCIGINLADHQQDDSIDVNDLNKQPINVIQNSVDEATDKVSKGAKIRNRYNQVPHLTQDTNGKVWVSVIVLCFVVRYFMSILVLQSS